MSYILPGRSDVMVCVLCLAGRSDVAVCVLCLAWSVRRSGVCPMSCLVGLTWRCVSYVLPGQSDVVVCVLCLAWSV